MYAKVMAIDTTKGGVGKTTTCSALMEIFTREQHRRVLAIDLDGQATLSRWYGIDHAAPAMADVLASRVPIADIILDLGEGNVSAGVRLALQRATILGDANAQQAKTIAQLMERIRELEARHEHS